MTYTREQLQRFIDEIRDEGPAHGLTDRERDLVDSFAEQLEQRGTLSERQQEVLDRIYAERTPL